MTTYYKAAIDEDRIETRSTQSRKYVACVAVEWRRPGATHDDGYVTWCGTSDRAASEVAAARVKGRVANIAPAIEITQAEYRALKAQARAA
jgi:hypothetical protein